MIVDSNGGILPIKIVIETEEEREALIAGLDLDRNHPVRRELYDALRATRPLVPGQATLFDVNPSNKSSTEDADDVPIEKIWPTNLVEWAHGQEAGYRGDELIGPKSADFMAGYDQGRLSKAAYMELAKRTSAGE